MKRRSELKRIFGGRLSTPLLADELLEAARYLATLESDAAFRRAISTAYYAAFHKILDTACDRIFLPGLPGRLARRNFEHRQIKTAAKNFAEPGLTNEQRKYGLQQAPSEELRDFCSHIDDLGDARERADYDPSVNHQYSQASQMISLAEDVIAFCAPPYDELEFECLRFMHVDEK